MLSEEKIQEIYNRKLRLFDKTGNEKFLYQADILQEVLEISDKEAMEQLKTVQIDN